MRKAVWNDARALDESGIPVARFLAGAPPVEEHDRAAPHLQMQGRGHAGDAGAESDGVGADLTSLHHDPRGLPEAASSRSETERLMSVSLRE
jgi:hypothetical protein